MGLRERFEGKFSSKCCKWWTQVMSFEDRPLWLLPVLIVEWVTGKAEYSCGKTFFNTLCPPFFESIGLDVNLHSPDFINIHWLLTNWVSHWVVANSSAVMQHLRTWLPNWQLSRIMASWLLSSESWATCHAPQLVASIQMATVLRVCTVRISLLLESKRCAQHWRKRCCWLVHSALMRWELSSILRDLAQYFVATSVQMEWWF